MATYYWVGGSGNWSDATNHWASVSNGAPNAANLPTSADNVIFDQNSNVGTGTFTVTVDGTSASPSLCNDFSTSSLDGTMTLTMGATAQLDCYGSMTLPATNFAFSNTAGSILNFRATTTGKTFTTNGVTVPTVAINFNGVGGEWTLGSALTCGNITLINGSFVSGNFNITYNSFISSGTATRSISLGSSTLTASGSSPISFTGTGITCNAGTSTINCSGASPTFAGAGLTFYNVSFTSTAINLLSITGSNTFNNLSFTARAAAGIGNVTLDAGATNTVNGTLTLGSGTTGVARLFVRSSTLGTATTLSVATLAAMTDIDFRDITVAGASSPWSGTRIGNCLNNTNITFTVARTVYWVSAASANWNGAVWNTSSGTTGGATTNFPLAQDTVVIDNAGLTTGNTITLNANYNVGNLSFLTRSNAATFSVTGSPSMYGDYTLSSAITISGAGVLGFGKQGGTATITSAGKTFTQPTTIAAPNGTVRINGDLTLASTQTFTLTQGTLDLTNNGAGNYTLSTGLFSSNVSNTRAITFGTGQITVTGNAGTVWSMSTVTGFTYTGTSNVVFNYSGSTGTRTITFSTGATESNVLNMSITAGTDSITPTVNTKNLNFTGFSGTLNGSIRNIYGNLTISSGMTCVATTSATSFLATSGTQQITTNGNATIDFPITVNAPGATVQLQDNLTVGSTRTFTLTAGTLDLSSGNRTLSTGLFSSSNSNTRSILFGTGNITLTGNNATIWTTATVTNFSYTGTPTVNCTYAGSTGTRTVTISTSTTEAQAVSFNVSAGSDSVAGFAAIKNLNFTGFTGTLANSNRSCYGNVVFSSGMTCTAGTLALTFAATSGTQQITTNGNTTIDFPITQNGVGGTVQLQDNLTTGSTRTFTLTNGTLDLNNNVLSIGNMGSVNTNTRAILFGTGSINLTNNSATIWSMSTADNFTYTGTPTVNATYAGSTGTRTITFGSTSGVTASNALNFNVTAGSDSTVFSAKINNLNFTGFSGTLGASTLSLYGNLVISSGMSTTSVGGSVTFIGTTGTQQITTAGKTFDFSLAFNGVGGTFQFQDALTQNTGRAFNIINGTVQFQASTTNTVGYLVTIGTATKALQSTIPGTQATISQASGDVYAAYITITDSNATGGANFYATAASNGGNNTGWNFATNFYYWVGGDGNWSDAANHWSNASGGSPSASYLPTAADIVIFDANSNVGTAAFNVTVDGTVSSPSLCNDFVCGTGVGGGALDGAMTLTMGATARLYCYGSMTLPATNLTWTGTSGAAVYFSSTTTGKTVTSNGVSFTTTALVFDAVGGGWSLGSALTLTNFVYANSGTFNTANYSITASGFLRNDATNPATINLGSSTLTVNSTVPISILSSGLTFNAGTSSIICSAASPTFTGGGLTFYNVSFTSTAIGNIVITGSNTYNNLSFTARAAAGEGNVAFDAGGTNTVNGTLTFGSGTTGVARLLVRSVTAGTATTISAATLTAPTDVDFRDITAAGAVIPWSGTRLGNCLGNTNITFGAGTTKYWVSPASGNWSGAVWSTTSGNTGGTTTEFPLPQDSIVIDDAGLTAGNVITVNAPYQIPNLSFATRSNAATFATGSQTPTFYGDLTYSTAVTPTGTAVLTFNKQGGTLTITSAGITFPQPVTMLGKNGTMRINGDLTLTSANTFTLTQGTLDITNGGAGNYTLSTGLFNSNNSNTRSIAFGTGNILVTGTSNFVVNMDNATNFTLTGTPIINVSANESVGFTKGVNIGNSATSANPEANAISINILGGTQPYSIYGAQFKDLNFNSFSGQWNEVGAITLYGNLTLSSTMTFPTGTNPGTTISFKKTTGTQTATFNGVTVDRPLEVAAPGGTVAFQDALTQTTGRAFTFNNGTLQFKSGTTNTVGVFATGGTTLKYLQATTPGSQATITTVDTTPVYATYLNVKDSYAAQVNFWHALFTDNCQNGGNNTNWIFNASNNNFFMMFA